MSGYPLIARTYDVGGCPVVVDFSHAAMRVVEETRVDVAADLTALSTGERTAELLLAVCLEGADLDREQGWHDYVDALVVALDMLKEGR